MGKQQGSLFQFEGRKKGSNSRSDQGCLGCLAVSNSRRLGGGCKHGAYVIGCDERYDPDANLLWVGKQLVTAPRDYQVNLSSE